MPIFLGDVKVAACPLPDGQVYPASPEDIVAVLDLLSAPMLVGLDSVILKPITKKDSIANGRYVRSPRPQIHVFAFPESRIYSYKTKESLSALYSHHEVELGFGMSVQKDGNTVVCSWSEQNLRRFTCLYLLLHEVGHHIRAERLIRSGREYKNIWSRESELEADAIARELRVEIERNGRLPKQLT